jgi:hypothetical protein
VSTLWVVNASMKANTAEHASARVRQRLPAINSVSKVAKKLSASALS